MLSYMVKAGLHSYYFLDNLFRVPADRDVFATLISPTMRNDIASFVDRHFQAALLSRERRFSLQSRFCVTSIGINKAGITTKFESLSIWVHDRQKFKQHEFVIGGVPARDSDESYTSRFSIFCKFPRSEAVFDSLKVALQNMRCMTSDSVPLLPLTNCPGPPESSLRLTPPDENEMSLIVEAVAMGRRESQSISQQILITGISGRPLQALIPEVCIRRFNPVALSLFDVALLAKVVHDYAPMYCLFDNHHYMFASVMFDAVVQLYSSHPSVLNPASSTSTYVPAPTPEVGPPENANSVFLPDVHRAGHWYKYSILDPIVKSTIVSIVLSEFQKQRDSFMEAGFN